MSNVPPWPVFIEELRNLGMDDYADIIEKHHLG